MAAAKKPAAQSRSDKAPFIADPTDPAWRPTPAPFRSIGDRVLVKPDPKPKVSKGGLIIPATARSSEPMRAGHALSVGGAVEHIKPGDLVMWPTHEGDFADGELGYELMSLHEHQISLVLEG